MTKRILITGGAGFIGTHLAERLCERAPLVLLDNFRRDSLASVPRLREHANVSVVSADVCDGAALERALDGVGTVLHLAAIAGVTSYYRESLRTLQVNILGTAALLERAAPRGIDHFVHFSTSEVFGSDALWVGEEAGFHIGPLSDRRWVYATSKLAGEQLALRWAEEAGFRCSIVRPFNVYGPRQTGEGAISNFCAAAVAGRPLTVYGDGSTIRAWCYVSDLVDAVMAIIERGEGPNEAFNVGNPTEVETTLGLARRIVRLVPGTRLAFEPVERAEVRVRIPDVAKATRVLGFTPRIALDEGLERTLALFRTRPRA